MISLCDLVMDFEELISRGNFLKAALNAGKTNIVADIVNKFITNKMLNICKNKENYVESKDQINTSVTGNEFFTRVIFFLKISPSSPNILIVLWGSGLSSSTWALCDTHSEKWWELLNIWSNYYQENL